MRLMSTEQIPRELSEVLAEDQRGGRAFARLAVGDRAEYIRYVADSRIPEIRARRAALVMMNLASRADAA